MKKMEKPFDMVRNMKIKPWQPWQPWHLGRQRVSRRLHLGRQWRQRPAPPRAGAAVVVAIDGAQASAVRGALGDLQTHGIHCGVAEAKKQLVAGVRV